MSKLDEAEKRLNRALSVLEAVGAPPGSVSPSQNPIEDDLRAAQAEVGKLRALNKSMAEKLDDIIQRIKSIMEN